VDPVAEVELRRKF